MFEGWVIFRLSITSFGRDFCTCEKAEQAYKEAIFAESRKFADFYGESYMEKTDVGVLIINSSDDSYWTLVRLHESEIL